MEFSAISAHLEASDNCPDNQHTKRVAAYDQQANVLEGVEAGGDNGYWTVTEEFPQSLVTATQPLNDEILRDTCF